MKTVLITISVLLFAIHAKAQCSTIGQTPVTAFPVCGVDTFRQTTVPICQNNTVPASSCGSYPDTNPFWYQFTCFQSGTLGFLITPDTLTDDYDWSLFDITNHNPADVFDSSSLLVTYNWSGNTSTESARGYTGITGTSPSGTIDFACATNPQELGGTPPYSDALTINKMPNIIAGHKYLLLVSHYTQTQSGYRLTFNGGTAVITDPGIPSLKSAEIECDHQTIAIKLSKQVRCNSLAADGSDFSLSSASASIVSATGVNCNSGFDMDSIVLTLSNVLPSGNYIISAKIGIDGNTLLDDCNNDIAVGDNESFVIVPIAPTPLDSIVPLACSPTQLQLVFSRPIECSSISTDGSDFGITGPSPVTIQSAAGVCDTNNLTNTININLTSPILTGGIYQIKLAPGIDGNTIIDKCNLQTPSGSTLNFAAADTVSAQFSYQLLLGCKIDRIQFFDDGKNGINQWQWSFDSVAKSTQQNPIESYTIFGNKTAQLIVSNGVCSDTSQTTILLDNTLKASFTSDDHVCPEDKAPFTNTSIGNIVSWSWDFGDGTTSSDSMPEPHSFPQTLNEVDYNVRLIVENAAGCVDTATRQIRKLRSCYIDVPSAFTPNGDSNNDYLYPLNAYKAINLEFRVYNRYGQLVFETKDWTRKWDGTIGGKPQPTGTYVWMLEYINRDTGKKYALKGTTVLIR